jgi:ribulose-5-phosphate 4-epimerase/fuculose-1-phosphate aldolase
MGQLAAKPIQNSVCDEERKLRENLAAFYRLAWHYGWGCDLTNNHISLRTPGVGHHFLLNSFDMVFEEITASSLIKVDVAGNLVESSGRLVNKAGFCIHSTIHEARADARCIAHFHSQAGIAIGARREGLLPISAHAIYIHGRGIAYHDYEGVVIDDGELNRLVRDLGDNQAMFLRNHGTLALGSTIAEAFYNAYMLETACQIQVAANTGASNLIVQGPEVVSHFREQMADNFTFLADVTWESQVRMMDRKSPSFRD